MRRGTIDFYEEAIMKRFKIRQKIGQDSGFTLIELLVVIIIIGILAGIAVVGVSGARNSAQKAACKADAAQLIKGLRAFSAASNLQFPTVGGSAAPTIKTLLNAEISELWLPTSTNASKGKFIENAITSYGITTASAWSSTLAATSSSPYVLRASILNTGGDLVVAGFTPGSTPPAAGTAVAANTFQGDCLVTG